MYYRPDFPESEVEALCELYFRELGMYPATLVQDAVRSYMRSDGKFFPVVGQLLALIPKIDPHIFEIQYLNGKQH